MREAFPPKVNPNKERESFREDAVEVEQKEESAIGKLASVPNKDGRVRSSYTMPQTKNSTRKTLERETTMSAPNRWNLGQQARTN